MSGNVRRVSLLIIGAVLTGCAHLNVTVDIASPHVVQRRIADELIRESLPEARRQSQRPQEVDTLIGATIELLERRYIENRMLMIEREPWSRGGSSTGQKARQEQLRSEFLREVAPRYRVIANSWKHTNEEIEETYRKWSLCDRCWTRWRNHASGAGLKRVVPRSAAGEANRDSTSAGSADAECERLQPRPDCGELENTREYLVALLKRREGYIQQVQSALQSEDLSPREVRRVDALKSLIGEDGLFRSAEAHAIAAAKPADWVRKFDESHANAFMGDVNVALKMETRGSFTVKGLSFDPSEIARVASRVMTQTLIAATQPASLVAMSKSQRIEAEETGVNEVTALDERKKIRRQALLALAARVIAEEGSFEKPESAKDAVKAISNAWSAHSDMALLDRVTHSGPEVIALLPEKLLVEPGQQAPLLIALAAPAEKDTPLLITSSDGEIATVDPKPVTLMQGARTKQVTIEGKKKIGTAEISAGTSDGRSAKSTVCVAPLLKIDDVPELRGPQETKIKVSLADATSANKEFVPDVALDVRLSSEGTRVQLDPSVKIDKQTLKPEFTLRPLDAGAVTVTATSQVPVCDMARTASRQITIAPSEVKWETPPAAVEVSSETRKYVLNVEHAPPEELELTVQSSDPSVLQIVDGGTRKVTNSGGVTVEVRGVAAGQATLTVSSSRTLFKAPEPALVTVIAPSQPQ